MSLAILGGAVDKIAVAIIAFVVYLYIPGTYSKSRPLMVWSVKVPLPHKTLGKLLVTDFQRTAHLWVDARGLAVSRVVDGFLVRTDALDTIVNWKKIAASTWEQSLLVGRKRSLLSFNVSR